MGTLPTPIFIISVFSLVLVSSASGILNRQNIPSYCNSDNDCGTGETLLFCQEGKCTCLKNRVALVHGVLLNLNMDWSGSLFKCVSLPGSPCTFKGRWYSTDVTKLDCSPDSSCLPPAPHSSTSGGGGSQNYNNYNSPSRQGQIEQGSSWNEQIPMPLTPKDFGICWNTRQVVTGGSAAAATIETSGSHQYQQPVYPVLTPQHQQVYYPQGNLEFSPHKDLYPPQSPGYIQRNSARQMRKDMGCTMFSMLLLWVVIFGWNS